MARLFRLLSINPRMVTDKNGHQRTVYAKMENLYGEFGAGKDDTVEEGSSPVHHEGEFVLTTDGNKNFGEISPDVAQAIRRQAGGIRLRAGEQNGKPGDYGEKHMERKERLQELYSSGYRNARDFVQDVARNYTSVYGSGSGRLALYKKIDKKGISLFIELLPSPEGDFYDVKTGMITRDTYYKNKKPLWERPQSG